MSGVRMCDSYGCEDIPATQIGVFDDGDNRYPDTAYCDSCAATMTRAGEYQGTSIQPPVSIDDIAGLYADVGRAYKDAADELTRAADRLDHLADQANPNPQAESSADEAFIKSLGPMGYRILANVLRHHAEDYARALAGDPNRGWLYDASLIHELELARWINREQP